MIRNGWCRCVTELN